MSKEYEEKPDDHSPRPSQPLLFDGFEEPVSHASPPPSLPANMQQKRHDGGRQATTREKKSRLAERLC